MVYSHHRICASVLLALGSLWHSNGMAEPTNETSENAWQLSGVWTTVGQRHAGEDRVDASKKNQLNTRLDLELQKEFSGQNARFYGLLRSGAGSGLQLNTPVFTSSINTTAFAGSDHHLHDLKSVLAQAWLQFDLPNVANGLSVVAGKIDPSVFFDHNEIAHDESLKFMNNIFVHNPLLDSGGNYGIDENGFSPGALVQYETQHSESPNWMLSLGAFGAGNGQNLDYSPSNPFLITQVRRFGELFTGLQGSFAAYCWTNPKAENFLTAEPEKQTGWGVSFDQQIKSNLTLFGRLSYGIRGTRSFDRALTYGIEHKGDSLGLPDDHVAIAIGHLRPDHTAVSNGAPNSTEHSIELLYSHALKDNWWVAADLQRIKNPGGDPAFPSVRVLGLRSTVKF